MYYSAHIFFCSSFSFIISHKMILNGPSSVAENITDRSVSGNILTRTFSSLSNYLVHSGVREVSAVGHDVLLCTHVFCLSFSFIIISDIIFLKGMLVPFQVDRLPPNYLLPPLCRRQTLPS